MKIVFNITFPAFFLLIAVHSVSLGEPKWKNPGAVITGQEWRRHVIDDGLNGADGVRLADINADGRADIVTGWEESGKVRAYLNPGSGEARTAWPHIQVGVAANVEDAVAVDLNGDGRHEIVSASEGKTRALHIHWCEGEDAITRDSVFRTEVLPPSRNVMMWMFVLPHDVNGNGRIDLIAGGKGPDAAIGWFEAPADPLDLHAWKWHPLGDVGWLMSLVDLDVNEDGYEDILYSDQRGETAGVYWLEHPGEGADLTQPWKRHSFELTDYLDEIGAPGRRIVCFLSHADLDGDGLTDILVAANRQIVIFRKVEADGSVWEPFHIPLPDESSGAKSARVADMDQDGRMELVYTTLTAKPKHVHGVLMVQASDPLFQNDLQFYDVAGRDGEKFDLLELLDVSGNGYLDIVTCEERSNLGVVWYEQAN